jgi:hypothetical protein
VIVVALCLIAGATPAVAVAGTPRHTVEVPPSIDATGKSDVSASLQSFIDRVPDGSRIVFQRSGTYRLSRGIQLNDRRDLDFKGGKSTLRVSGCAATNSAFVLGWSAPSAKIKIRGFTLKGSNPTTGTTDAYHPGCEFQMGVAVYQSTHVRLRHLKIRRVYGDCLYLADSDLGGSWTSNVTLEHSRCIGTGRSGVAITAARNVLVRDSTFDKIGMYVLNIEANDSTGGGAYVRFAHNQAGSYGWEPEFSHFVDTNGAVGASVNHVAVVGNVVDGGTLSARVQTPGTHHIKFSRNTSAIKADGPVVAAFDNVDHVTVVHNHQPLRAGTFAWFRHCTDVTFRP